MWNDFQIKFWENQNFAWRVGQRQVTFQTVKEKSDSAKIWHNEDEGFA